MVCAGSARIQNCDAFCQRRCNSVKAPHFHGKTHRNPAKGAAILHGHQSAGLLAGERDAKPRCFQVPLRCVCCILFDAYCINILYLSQMAQNVCKHASEVYTLHSMSKLLDMIFKLQRMARQTNLSSFNSLEAQVGLEPATHCLLGRCSISELPRHLSWLG